jgi:D-alanyl-D-alanine carboxypeptidase
MVAERLAGELTDFLTEEAAADRFSGAVLLAHGVTILVSQAYGYANPADAMPNRVDTRFNLASVTKGFTGVAVAQLAERGTLAFDDLVGKHLPSYPSYVADHVSIHQLLTHTSGLGRFWNDSYRARRSELRSVSDYLPLIADEPLAFRPGSDYLYGNSGYVILGAIIEQVSGQDYFDYLQEHIYAPAGMTGTSHIELDRPPPNVAVGYTNLDWDGCPYPDGRRNNLFLYAVRGSPANGAYSTVGDLLAFEQALRQHRLLGPAMTEQVMSAQVQTEQPDIHYGYGFFVFNRNGRRSVALGGRGLGADAFLHCHLELGYTLAILSNYDRPAAKRVLSKLWDMLEAA